MADVSAAGLRPGPGRLLWDHRLPSQAGGAPPRQGHGRARVRRMHPRRRRPGHPPADAARGAAGSAAGRPAVAGRGRASRLFRPHSEGRVAGPIAAAALTDAGEPGPGVPEPGPGVVGSPGPGARARCNARARARCGAQARARCEPAWRVPPPRFLPRARGRRGRAGVPRRRPSHDGPEAARPPPGLTDSDWAGRGVKAVYISTIRKQQR